MGRIIKVNALVFIFSLFFHAGINAKTYLGGGPVTITPPPTLTDDGDVTEIDLFSQQFNFQCLNVDSISAIKGQCWWYKVKCCFYLQFKWSFIVSHLIPEVVTEVSATDQSHVGGMMGFTLSITEWAEDLIWTPFMKSQFGSAVAALGTNGGHEINSKTQKVKPRANVKSLADSRLDYYDVHMFGNPAYPIIQATVNTITSSFGFGLCDSETSPYQPVFSSRLSPEWSMGIWEAAKVPMNITRSIENEKMKFNVSINGYEDASKTINNVGNSLPTVPYITSGSKWGWVYPRTAFIESKSRYRAAATIAQRAADIVGGDGSGLHVVFKSLSAKPPTTGSFRYYNSGYIKEKPEGYKDSDSEHNWQMSYPNKDSSCKRFPTAVEEIESMDNSFVWTLWKRYTCCADKGRFFTDYTW